MISFFLHDYLVENEESQHTLLAWTILLSSPIIFGILTYVPSPWGKTLSPGWGPLIPAKIAWCFFESPNLVASYLCWNPKAPWVHQCLLALFVVHYLQRAILYPLWMSQNTRPMPMAVVCSAFCFCGCNGYLQAQGLMKYLHLPVSYHQSPWFVLGIGLWALGFYINLHSDRILRTLRTQSKEYPIPHGGWFQYVSAPHYLGELLEWFGYMLACRCSLPSMAFWCFSFSNLVPRAVAHHAWYHATFGDKYPRHRKAVIPWIW